MKNREEMLTWLVKNVTEWPTRLMIAEKFSRRVMEDDKWMWTIRQCIWHPTEAIITRDDWQQARNTYSPADLRLQEEVSRVKPSATAVAGVKHDGNKWRFSLLPWKALSQVVAVLEFGAIKYAPDNWQKVDNHRERYFNASQRHIMAWWQGEKNDSESGLHHLAHACCCILFLLHMEADK